MFGQPKSNVTYVKVKRNKFIIRNIGTDKEAELSAIPAFTTKRLLVGEFSVAEQLLKSGINKVHTGILIASPIIVIHPLEMVEGGLSQIEDQALRELAAGAGARKVLVWVGHELTDDEVRAKAKESI